MPVVSNETLAEIYEGVKERFGSLEPQEAMRQLATGMRRQKVEVRRAELCGHTPYSGSTNSVQYQQLVEQGVEVGSHWEQ